MSTEPVRERAKETLKTVKELLEKAEDSTQKALEKAAPKVQRSVDVSLQAAAKGFTTTMGSIDMATKGDQVKLLKAYRRFLGGQVEFIVARIKVLEKRAQNDGPTSQN